MKVGGVGGTGEKPEAAHKNNTETQLRSAKDTHGRPGILSLSLSTAPRMDRRSKNRRQEVRGQGHPAGKRAQQAEKSRPQPHAAKQEDTRATAAAHWHWRGRCAGRGALQRTRATAGEAKRDKRNPESTWWPPFPAPLVPLSLPFSAPGVFLQHMRLRLTVPACAAAAAGARERETQRDGTGVRTISLAFSGVAKSAVRSASFSAAPLRILKSAKPAGVSNSTSMADGAWGSGGGGQEARAGRAKGGVAVCGSKMQHSAERISGWTVIPERDQPGMFAWGGG